MNRTGVLISIFIIFSVIACHGTAQYEDVKSRDIFTYFGRESTPVEVIEAVIEGQSVPVTRVTLPPVVPGEYYFQRQPFDIRHWNIKSALKFYLRSDDTSLRFVVKIYPRTIWFETCDLWQYEHEISLKSTGWQEIILPLSRFYGNVTMLPYVVNQLDPTRLKEFYLTLEQVTETSGEFSYEMGPVTELLLGSRFSFY